MNISKNINKSIKYLKKYSFQKTSKKKKFYRLFFIICTIKIFT